MNYSVDHKLLQDDYIETLTGSIRHISWLSLCVIVHFTKHTGSCNFYSTGMSEDFNCKPATIKKALEGLMSAGLIKRTRLYQRNGNIPAQYIALKYVKRYSPIVKKVHPLGSQGIAPRAKVNNYNNYKYNDNDFYDKSSSSNGKEIDHMDKLVQQEIEREKRKQQTKSKNTL